MIEKSYVIISCFIVHILQSCNQKYVVTYSWAPAWGGGKSRPSPSPPPLGKSKKIVGNIVGLFATFSPYGGLFATFFSLWGPLLPCGGLFATFFSP